MLICPAVYELCEQQGSGRQQKTTADDEGQAEAVDEKAADHGSRHAAEISRCQEQAVAEIRRIRCHAGQQVLIDVRIDAAENAPGHDQCRKKRQQLPTTCKEQAVERDGTQREKAYGHAGTPGEEIAPQIASADVQETIDEEQRCDELSR